MRATAIVVSAALLLAPAVVADSATSLSGEVAINTTSTGEVLVALDVEPADGIADYRFVLQQEEPFETVSAYLDSAQVLVRDDQIRIRGGKVALLLLTDGAKARLPRQREPWQVIEGYGLSRSWGSGFGLPIDIVASESHYREEAESLDPQQEWLKNPPEGPNGGPTQAVCDAGGQGATQCSVENCEGSPSACSVTCTGNKYACCRCRLGTESSAKCSCWPNELGD